MKRRFAIIAVVAAVIAVAVGTYAYANRPVTVKTGERVVCSYGHTVKDTVRDLRVSAGRAKGLGVKTSVVVCPIHAAAEKLYDEAQKALAEGDTKTALAKLRDVERIDPDFKRTEVQIREIDAGRKPKPDTSGRPADPATPPGDGVTPPPAADPTTPPPPTGPVASLLRYVPDTISGYTAKPVESDEISLSRQYAPTASEPVASLVVAAEQFKSAEAARAAITSEIEGYYSTGKGRVAFSGRDAFFGTRAGFAVLAWNEDGIRIVVEMRSSSGDATALKPALTAVAEQVVR